MSKNCLTRRDFMQLGARAAVLGAAAKVTLLESNALTAPARAVPPSDTVRFASIGTGVRGCELIQATLRIPGVEGVAICDLYDSRHVAGREWLKKEVPVTRDYRVILDRKDVDAIILASTDHWHRQILEDACAAGKDVYCEKPMSHTVEDGLAMVRAAQKHQRIVQVGSQRVSSILYAKAKEIVDSGKLGLVTAIEGYWDRNTASGAWIYPIPPDANEQTIDWIRFLGRARKRPFDPVRFFRWRCFEDYGSGLAGDLFVHLTSGIHFIAGTNSPPQRATSSGGLFRWKEQREFPDLIWTLYDYPDFRVALRCNLNNEGGEFVGFYGTKGTLLIKGSTLTFSPQDTRPQPEGYSIFGWPKKLREEYLEEYRRQNPLPGPLQMTVDAETETYVPPPKYSDTVDHLANFFNSVRTRRSPVENEVFGHHAALACHMANYSYFHRATAVWDAKANKIVKA